MFVTSITGNRHAVPYGWDLDIKGSTTVRELRAWLAIHVDAELARQRLVFACCALLDEDRSMADYNIQQGGTIHAAVYEPQKLRHNLRVMLGGDRAETDDDDHQ